MTDALAGPAGLIVEGEPGIGKTTLWLEGVEYAASRGFRVLASRPAATESVLAYASAADLLAEVRSAQWRDLPPPQRRALDRMLLLEEGQATDQRTVAAGFLAVIDSLSRETPVLLAVDDLQWLDVSSRNVLAYAVRRLSGPVGLLGCVRTDVDGKDHASWLQLPRPEAMNRIEVAPLKLGGLRKMVSDRLGRTLSRSTMVRVWETSGGNPFYALELARAFVDGSTHVDAPLPNTLNSLVRNRIGDFDGEVADVLLAAACMGTPTVKLVARATGIDDERIVELLADAESKGILAIEGYRIRFAHPLLARGVYIHATPTQRRAMHRRLADAVDEPELQARHLAMAATRSDPRTLAVIDAAAEKARERGAPAAAAELLGLAMDLGGDTPERQILLARNDLTAGDTARAREVVEEVLDRLPQGALRAQASSLLASVHLFADSFLEAASVLERALVEAGDDPSLRTRLLITLTYARYNAYDFAAAEASIDEAVAHAERLGARRQLSQALRMRVVLQFLRGGGVDDAALARALQLDDMESGGGPIAFRPSMQNAMLLAWTLHLDDAKEQLRAIRQHCIERGEEGELIFVASQAFLVESWMANFDRAGVIADEMIERALQLGGDVPHVVAMTARGTLAAYAGLEAQARRDLGEAVAASGRSGASFFAVWPITSLGFLEVSAGNYEAALATLEPLLRRLQAEPQATEIVVAWFVPHAVEALLALDRIDEAVPLVDMLEDNGARLDRGWMLAVGRRCRAMLLAATGDSDSAYEAVKSSMSLHDRVPMPFERARTQLLMGQLQRRIRQKNTAATTLREAAEAFDAMGVSLWADRARNELARADVAHIGTDALTPSEQRVAEMAASGMTNRDIAAALFVSPKTVEANLARVDRKLDIRSRAQLGRHIVSQG